MNLPAQSEKKEGMLELLSPNEKLLRAPTIIEKFQQGKVKYIFFIILAFIIVDAGIYMLLDINKSTSETNKVYKEIPLASPTHEVKSEKTSKIYKNSKWGIQLEYPSSYKYIEQSETLVIIAKDELGTGGIKIASSEDINYVNTASIKPCAVVNNQIKKNSAEEPSSCLEDGRKFGQAEDIATTTIGIKAAKSFYVKNIDRGNTWHVLKTIDTPLLQFTSTDPDEAGFDQIVSIITFTDQLPTTPVLSPGNKNKVCTTDAVKCPDGTWVGRSGPDCTFVCSNDKMDSDN